MALALRKPTVVLRKVRPSPAFEGESIHEHRENLTSLIERSATDLSRGTNVWVQPKILDDGRKLQVDVYDHRRERHLVRVMALVGSEFAPARYDITPYYGADWSEALASKVATNLRKLGFHAQTSNEVPPELRGIGKMSRDDLNDKLIEICSKFIHNETNRSTQIDPSKQVVLVRSLIAAGADVNAAGKEVPHYRGARPLHAAMHSGNPDLVRELLANGADPNLLTKDGQNVLSRAIRNISEGTPASIKLLLDAHANPYHSDKRAEVGNVLELTRYLYALWVNDKKTPRGKHFRDSISVLKSAMKTPARLYPPVHTD